MKKLRATFVVLICLAAILLAACTTTETMIETPTQNQAAVPGEVNPNAPDASQVRSSPGWNW